MGCTVYPQLVSFRTLVPSPALLPVGTVCSALWDLVLGFPVRRKFEFSTWADTKDGLLLILRWGLKHNALLPCPALGDRRARGDTFPTLAWEGGK